MSNQKKNYIDTNTMFDEWVKSSKNGKISNELGLMFYKLAEKNANHRYFVRYTHIRDELISEGVLGCIRGFPKFRPFRNDEENSKIIWDGESDIIYHHTLCNSPFSYYTRIIHNAFKQFLKQHEYKQRNISNSLRELSDLPTDEGYNDMVRQQANDDPDNPYYDHDYNDDENYTSEGYDPSTNIIDDIDDDIFDVLSSDNKIGSNEPEEEEVILW